MSIERLLLALEAKGIELETNDTLDLYIVAMDDEAKLKSVELASSFRTKGITTELDYANRKMKAQMKAADRTNAKFVIVLGGNELEEQAVNVKNMETGDQEKVAFGDLVQYILEKK